MDRYEARAAVVEGLRALGQLAGEAPHPMVVGHCERCGTVVEPRLSVQWFVRTAPLAARALASVNEGRTRIVPDHFEKVFRHWMENIHDWAVSRQLWWGHRIPAWYCPDGHITVSDQALGPDGCDACGRPPSELRQETDIFDTWFSSGLWPFSTLGWPDDTPDMRRFYPTSVMETGYDIIFFWVARMMMLGLFCTDVEPFHTVYLHGIVRAEGGVKMSKTKGNVSDPLEVVEEVGADALRYALIAGTAPGSDQRLTEAKLDGARNFTNKLWNAARFVIGARPEPMSEPGGERTLPERWIRSRLADATARATHQLDTLDFSAYAAGAYDFAWSDYCDWFIEAVKVELRREDASAGDRARVWLTAADTLASLLRLLHPIMPFVTEAIWTHLHELDPSLTANEPLLIGAAWPSPSEPDPEADGQMADLIELVRGVRNLRTEAGLPAGSWLPLTIAAAPDVVPATLQVALRYLEPMARARPIELRPTGARPAPGAPATTSRLGAAWTEDAAVPEAGPGTAAGRGEEHLREGISRLARLLADEQFVQRAPATVVQRERERLAELEAQLASLIGKPGD
jgi:valyl-tRNA synthetase